MNIRLSHQILRRYFMLVISMAVLFYAAVATFAQTTISTGSIQGTVTDPSGAVVSGAKVMVRNKETSQTSETMTNSSGSFASGALNPGNYVVRIEARGFRTLEMPLTVQVNTTSAANVRLTLGQSTEVVEVQAGEVSVNTEQSTVQGVLTSQQIEN